jgi:DDE superfamily endonuclease
MNIQVIADSEGNLLYVSDPTAGSMHDARSFYECCLDKLIPADNTIGDLGYVGCGIITGFTRSKLCDLRYDEKKVNTALARTRSRVEHVIRKIKNWKILSTGYRRPLKELPDIIKTVTTLEFFRTCY